jgi:DNA polymerase-3 subunit alpha
MVVTMAGMVEAKKNLITKSNKMMAFVDLEDLDGVAEVIVFPNVYERCRDVLFEDSVIAVRGRLNFKEGEVPKLLADNIVPLEEAEELRQERRGGGVQPYPEPPYPDAPYSDVPYPDSIDPEPGDMRASMPNRKPAQKVHVPDGPMLKIRIPQGVDETVVLYTLEGMFRVNLGKTPVLVYMQNGEIMRSKTQVDVSETLLQRLTGLVGKENVKMTGEKQ